MLLGGILILCSTYRTDFSERIEIWGPKIRENIAPFVIEVDYQIFALFGPKRHLKAEMIFKGLTVSLTPCHNAKFKLFLVV